MANPHPVVTDRNWGNRGAEPMPEATEPAQTIMPTRPYKIDGALNRMELNAEVPLTPEQQLWMAVLTEAVDDLGAGPNLDSSNDIARRRAQINQEARSWFLSDRSDVGSFRFVCDVLGLDAVYFRKKALSGHARNTLVHRVETMR